MTLSPNEAADALRDIIAIEARSHRAYGYRQASPHLILWGVLWAVGYGLAAAWPFRSNAIWTALVLIGLASGFLIERSSAARHEAQAGPIADTATRGARARLRWAFPGIALIAFAFITATLAVMAPVSGRQVGAFIPLVVAAGYAVLGIWRGMRFVGVGTALAGLTLGGFFLLPMYFDLWMAALGGGALILGGIWLRRA